MFTSASSAASSRPRCRPAVSSTRTPDLATDVSPSLHEMFTWRPPAGEQTGPWHAVRRKGSVPWTPPKTIPARGDAVTKNKLGALASYAVLAVGLAACGSSKSSSSSSSSSGTTASSGGGSSTVSGAGSTFAAPVYLQWGSLLSGVTVHYQALAPAAGTQ